MMVWIERNEPAPRRLLHPEPVGSVVAYRFLDTEPHANVRVISAVTGMDMTDTTRRVLGHTLFESAPEPAAVLLVGSL